MTTAILRGLNDPVQLEQMPDPAKTKGVAPAVALIDPKYPHNVGNAIRACACWGLKQLWWTGNRVTLDFSKGERGLYSGTPRLRDAVTVRHLAIGPFTIAHSAERN